MQGLAKHGEKYGSSLKHLLRQKQRLSFLRVIVCVLGQRTHEKSFLKALLMMLVVVKWLGTGAIFVCIHGWFTKPGTESVIAYTSSTPNDARR